MNKQDLQKSVSELNAQAAKIELIRKKVQMQLETSRHRYNEMAGAQKRRLAEIAMQPDMGEALREERARFDEVARNVKELPLMIAGLSEQIEAVGMEKMQVEDQLRQIHNEEEEQRRIDAFEKLRKEKWRGDWEQLMIDSGMEPEEFKYLQELYARKHKL